MANPAFEVLANLAGLSRNAAALALPAQVDVAPRWSGVGFSCLGFRFVVPMGQVSELMEVPSATRLPGVQNWVIGLSNVRGRLLPLFDLARFVGRSHQQSKKISPCTGVSRQRTYIQRLGRRSSFWYAALYCGYL